MLITGLEIARYEMPEATSVCVGGGKRVMGSLLLKINVLISHRYTSSHYFAHTSENLKE